jgi:hypothetical protein
MILCLANCISSNCAVMFLEASPVLCAVSRDPYSHVHELTTMICFVTKIHSVNACFQKVKNYNVRDYNFACASVWV